MTPPLNVVQVPTEEEASEEVKEDGAADQDKPAELTVLGIGVEGVSYL